MGSEHIKMFDAMKHVGGLITNKVLFQCTCTDELPWLQTAIHHAGQDAQCVDLEYRCTCVYVYKYVIMFAIMY